MFKILVYFVGVYIVLVNVQIAGGAYSLQLAGIFLPIHHMGHRDLPRVLRQMTITCGALALVTLLITTFWWTSISEITFIKIEGQTAKSFVGLTICDQK